MAAKKTRVEKAAEAIAAKERLRRRQARMQEAQNIRKRVTRMGDPDGLVADQNINAWCQAAIVRSGKSVSRIAEETGLSSTTVSRCFYGQTNRISFNTAMQLMRVAGAPLVFGGRIKGNSIKGGPHASR